MRMTATQLRAQLYSVLDRIAETGEPVELVRKGRTLRIVVADTPRTFSVDRLVPHPGTLATDSDDIVHIDWSKEWRPSPLDDK